MTCNFIGGEQAADVIDEPGLSGYMTVTVQPQLGQVGVMGVA